MTKIILIGLGGFFGSICRYFVSLLTARLLPSPFIPYGTLAVNISGCFLIGLLSGFFDARQIVSPEIRAMILIGVLGGFTTYSSFGIEVVTLFKQGNGGAAFAHVGLHLIFGIGAAFAGFQCSRLF